MLALLLMLSLSPAEPSVGTIYGTVPDAPRVRGIKVVFRDDKSIEYVGTLDTATGRFRIPGVPLGKPVDLIVDFATDSRLEGVNLRVPPSDFVDGDPPLTKADHEALKKLIARLNPFEDQVEILAIDGHVQQAALLLNKLRTKPFYESKPGEVIWRVEVWRFQREEPEDAWQKQSEELFTLHYRERCAKSVHDARSVTFDPKLGGLVIPTTAKELDLGEVRLPKAERGIRLRNAPPAPSE